LMDLPRSPQSLVMLLFLDIPASTLVTLRVCAYK